MPAPAARTRCHTANLNLSTYNQFPVSRHPNQSSIAGSFVRASRCRGEGRKLIRSLLLPLLTTGLLTMSIQDERIEAITRRNSLKGKFCVSGSTADDRKLQKTSLRTERENSSTMDWELRR